ncbi:alkene reductase [Brachymonas denitrificans]|uniref:alkene reductase n=1 Tax=Brachymonas denitrificans TaxID=28220 RepID=UPI00352C5949
MPQLFDTYPLAGRTLPNRIVMAPMTRARSPSHVPDELLATYYSQRASAGLIVTEGVPISPAAHGVLYVPGLYTPAQIAGWRTVTEAVHAEGGTIFAQLWHVGRASHASLQPNGQAPLSSTSQASDKIMTFALDAEGKPGFVPATPPRAMTTAEVQQTVQDFAQAAANAIEAGFDGIEIHSANGYLLEQFLNPHVNDRTDQYGADTLENRCRFVLEVVDAIIERIGAQRTGIRFSPWGNFNDMPPYDETAQTYLYLAGEMANREVAYIHLMDQHLGQGREDVSGINLDFLQLMRAAYPRGALILAGNMTLETGNRLLEAGVLDLVGFGQPFISNPDLVARLRNGWPLAQPDRKTYYGGGAEGYTDYPVWNPAAV